MGTVISQGLRIVQDISFLSGQINLTAQGYNVQGIQASVNRATAKYHLVNGFMIIGNGANLGGVNRILNVGLGFYIPGLSTINDLYVGITMQQQSYGANIAASVFPNLMPPGGATISEPTGTLTRELMQISGQGSTTSITFGGNPYDQNALITVKDLVVPNVFDLRIFSFPSAGQNIVRVFRIQSNLTITAVF